MKTLLSRLLLILTAAGLAGSVACRRAPVPEVQDLDSYNLVNLGAAKYTTPQGLTLLDRGQGFAEHAISYLPGTVLRVEVDPNPPRDLVFDADAERRQFLDQLGSRSVRSAQYHEVKNDAGELTQRRVKVFASAADEEGRRLHGALMVVRAGQNTATIRAVGPHEDRQEINHLVERMARLMELEG